MITSVAVCPHPPLLARELTGQQDIVADLRGACLSVIGSVIESRPDTIVVVGGDEVSGSHEPAAQLDFSEYGVTAVPRPRVEGKPNPLSLRVAQRLLGEAGWAGPMELVAVAWDASPAELSAMADRLAGRTGRTALLAMGDGSARRGEKAPGYVDDRAFGFDEQVGRALVDGDPNPLWDLDAGLADELMVGGRAAFQLLAAAVLAQASAGRASGSGPRAEMRYQDDPHGVMYFVAFWDLS